MAPPTLPARRSIRLRLAGVACLAALAAALAGGCSTPPGVVFDPADGVHQWPTPPDEPRIRYLGQLRSQDDLKPGVSGADGLGQALFGKQAGLTMSSPIAVCADAAERVFIADPANRVVHVFDLSARAYQRWAPRAEQGAFEQPVALAWDPAGRLLVADSVGAAIVVFDASGACLGKIGKGQLKRPCGLVVDPRSGRILIADALAHQIVVMSPAGEELGRIGERGEAPGQFNFPTNLALDSRGRLYVSDSLNFRVQLFDADLQPLRQIGRKGDMPGCFSQPKGVAVDDLDNLYVVDANFEALQLFDPDGRLLMSLGREGQGPGEFWLPAGIAIDRKGRIWIADSYNRRVQAFERLPEGKQP